MKLKFNCFIVFLMSVMLTYAADIELSDFSYNILSIENHTVEVVSSNASVKEVLIPSSVEYNGRKFTVTKLADQLFYQNWTIEQVSIPSSVETIGVNAFWGCTNLKELVIEDGDNSILLDYTYYSLQPAFAGCNNLSTLYIGRNISFSTQYIQASPFYGNNSLDNVEISSNVTTIPHYLFFSCKGLKKISLPNEIQTIGVRAFAECSNLQEVQLPSELKTIYWSAFEDCTSLSGIVLPLTLESIDRDAFRNTAITEITIPVSVKCIEGGAFFGSKLKSLLIEDSEEPIRMPKHSSQYSRNQFDNTELTNVYLGRNIDYQENEAYSKEGLFPYTVSHIEFSNYVTKINPFLLSYTHLKNIELTPSITSIGRNAFQNSTIENIVIPETILTIEARAFINCTNLATVKFLNDDLAMANSIFEGCTSLKSIVLPVNLQYIPASCFANCSSLETIDFPISLTLINGGAFKNCTSLSEITFPEELMNIDFDAFYGCSNLYLIKFGNHIATIGTQSFTGCPLNSILICNETPPSVNTNTFDNKVYLNAVLYVPDSAIANYEDADVWKNFGNMKDKDDFITGVHNIIYNTNVPYVIYDINGKEVYSGTEKYDLPSGLYIVRHGVTTNKVLIR